VTGVFDFKVWYAANREALSEKRKIRYQTDPEYKARVLNLNAEARRLRKKDKHREQKLEDKARVAGTAPPVANWKTIPIEVDGEEVQAFTIGALAKAVGRSIQAIRLYEKQGLIAETPYRSNKGDRLYTYAMVKSIHETLDGLGRVGVSGKGTRPAAKVFSIRFRGGDVQEIPLFRISYLARACRRTISTLEHMEGDGLFPETPLRAKQIRLYSAEMIEAAREVFSAVDIGDVPRDHVRAKVQEAWNDLGVMSARIVAHIEQTKEGLNGHDQGRRDEERSG